MLIGLMLAGGHFSPVEQDNAHFNMAAIACLYELYGFYSYTQDITMGAKLARLAIFSPVFCLYIYLFLTYCVVALDHRWITKDKAQCAVC